MASIVKTNAALAAGNLAVVKRAFSTQKEGKLTYTITYVCLAKFQRNNIVFFRTGAPPPTPFPDFFGALKIKDSPKLYDLQVNVTNGLCYFDASYIAIGDSESSYSVTTSSEQRSFQASETKQVATGPQGFVAINEAVDTISFDYISKSVTVSSNNTELPRVGIFDGAGVGAIFNIRKSRSFTGGSTFEGQGSVKYESTIIESSSSTQNSDGTYTYSLTSTGVYVASAT